MTSLDKMIRQLLWGESKGVSTSVKTKVRKRARRKCEYPRCKKRPTEFHHWRDPATERTTAFLCHKHHVEKGHTWSTRPDILGNELPFMRSRKRIPIPRRTNPKKTRTRKKR